MSCERRWSEWYLGDRVEARGLTDGQGVDGDSRSEEGDDDFEEHDECVREGGVCDNGTRPEDRG